MQLRETRFASFSSYRGARQICMQACDFSRYSRKKEAAGLYRPPKVRPKNLTIGGRYFYG